MKVLGLVPARGGSKGIARKNIRLLCGKPLLQYTAESALGAARLTRVILSTDDEEIAKTGEQCGLEVPFLRPSELARDDTPMLPVIEHALNWVEAEDELYDAVCLLQPTSPLRRSEDIDGCIYLLETTDADAVVTVLSVPNEHNPHWVYFRDEQGLLKLSTGESNPIPRRQDLPAAYHREGSVYVTRREIVINGHSIYGNRLAGFELDAEETVNIDRPEDWEKAERLLNERITACPERQLTILNPNRS